jgi:hypothetical protein
MVYTPSLDSLVYSASERTGWDTSIAAPTHSEAVASAGEEAQRTSTSNQAPLRLTVDPDSHEGRLRNHAAMPPMHAKSHLVFTSLPDKGKVALYPGQGMRMDYIGKRDRVVRKAATGAGVIGDDHGPGLTIAQDGRPGGTTGLRVLQVDRRRHAFARGVRPARRLAPPNCPARHRHSGARPRSSQAGYWLADYASSSDGAAFQPETWGSWIGARQRPASVGGQRPEWGSWEGGSTVEGAHMRHPAVAQDDEPVEFARSLSSSALGDGGGYGVAGDPGTSVVSSGASRLSRDPAPAHSLWGSADGPVQLRQQMLAHPEDPQPDEDEHDGSWMETMSAYSNTMPYEVLDTCVSQPAGELSQAINGQWRGLASAGVTALGFERAQPTICIRPPLTPRVPATVIPNAEGYRTGARKRMWMFWGCAR